MIKVSRNRKSRQKTTIKDRFSLFLLGNLSVGLFVLQTLLANGLFSGSREISDLNREKSFLISQETELKNSLADSGSLEKVREAAFKIGMIESIGETDYLLPQKVAYKQ